MNDLEALLSELAERGVHVGTEELRQRVMLDLAGRRVPGRSSARGWAIAVAAAVIAILLIGTPLILLPRSDRPIPPSRSNRCGGCARGERHREVEPLN